MNNDNYNTLEQLNPNFDRPSQYKKIQQALANFYKVPTVRLITFLRQEGYSDTKIAEIMGISKQAVGQSFPREGSK